MTRLRLLSNSDALLALVLCVSLCWPLWIVSFPPYQDLYGHGATIEVIRRIGDYPEFERSGYIRSNACLTTLGALCTRFMSVPLFMKAISTATVYVTSFALLRFLRAFRQTSDLTTVLPFLPPLAHHWFISMGMLNYSIGFAFVLLMIASAKRSASLAVSSRAIWPSALLALGAFFCHPLPALLGVPFALGIGYASERDARLSRRYVLGLAPLFGTAFLSCISLAIHFVSGPADRARIVGAGAAEGLAWNDPLWVLYDAFAQSLWGMTKLSASSLVAFFGLVYFAVSAGAARTNPRLRVAFLVTLAIYIVTPYQAFGVYAGSPRVLLFLWPIALLAVPAKLSRGALLVTGISAGAYVVGMNVDIFRLAKEADHVARGASVIPDRAKLLPLFFATRKASENTRNFDSISSMYVWLRRTNAVDVWDHSSAYPIVRVRPPPANMTRARLIAFEAKADPIAFRQDCAKRGVGIEGCAASLHALFGAFFAEAAPEYSHVLLWAPPTGTLEAAAPYYHAAFRDQELVVLERNAK